MPDQKDAYEVGYRKPPRASRFERGMSGNPKGRPKGAKNLAAIVLKESRQPVRVNGPRGTRTVTKLQATVMQIGNKSAQGDLRASRDFIALIAQAEERATTGAAPLSIEELDQPVLESIRRRMARVENEMTNEEGSK